MKSDRNFGRSIEKIVSPIRLGWHGILTMGAGVAYLKFFNNDVLDAVIGGGIVGTGILFYQSSLEAFLRTAKNIRISGTLHQEFVNPQLPFYCNRQGTRTAAANYGFKKEFDEISANYQGRKGLKFIPHI